MSRRAKSCTVKLSGDNGEGGDADAAGGGVLIIGVDDELSLPLLEEAATTTCWEDAMVV